MAGGTYHITSNRMNLSMKSDVKRRMRNMNDGYYYSKQKRQLSKSELDKIETMEITGDRIKREKILLQLFVVLLTFVGVVILLTKMGLR